jgi:hypothetical protein
VRRREKVNEVIKIASCNKLEMNDKRSGTRLREATDTLQDGIHKAGVPMVYETRREIRELLELLLFLLRSIKFLRGHFLRFQHGATNRSGDYACAR